MLTRAVLLLSLALTFAGGVVRSQSAAAPGPAFKTVHVFNLPEGDAEQLTAIMRQYNALFVRLGHPEARYRLWKLESAAADHPAYLWESTWPSRAAYDQLHADAAYQELLKSTFPRLSQLLKDHAYGQYREVPLEAQP